MLVYENSNISVELPQKVSLKGQIEIIPKEDSFEAFFESFVFAINLSLFYIKEMKYTGINFIFTNKLIFLPRKDFNELNFFYPVENYPREWFLNAQKELRFSTLDELKKLLVDNNSSVSDKINVKSETKSEKNDYTDTSGLTQDEKKEIVDNIMTMFNHYKNKIP